MNSNLLKYYSIGVEYPDVSGFEILELLDMRSKLSGLEDCLTDNERETLERADGVLLDNLKSFHEKIQEVGNLPELRRRAKAVPSHWWWYMDKLINR